MELLFVGIGGSLGSLCRYQLSKVITQKFNRDFPIGTFMINISGAILLGIFTGIPMGDQFYLLLGDGFIGAYTTFSTFIYEGLNLFQGRDKQNGFLYLTGSFLFGIAGFFAGHVIGKLFIF